MLNSFGDHRALAQLFSCTHSKHVERVKFVHFRCSFACRECFESFFLFSGYLYRYHEQCTYVSPYLHCTLFVCRTGCGWAIYEHSEGVGRYRPLNFNHTSICRVQTIVRPHGMCVPCSHMPQRNGVCSVQF